MAANGLFTTKGRKIEIRGVKKSYMTGTTRVTALTGVDLDLEPGESVAIVGVSGCGKTTLLNLLGGVDVPDEGAIRVGDQDIAKLNERGLEQYRLHSAGFVFQFFNLIPSLTAMENLELNMTLAERPKIGARRPGDGAAEDRGDGGPCAQEAGSIERRRTTARRHCRCASQRSGGPAGRRTHRKPGHQERGKHHFIARLAG
jgi:putative ABC transport system ATP-binding protein